MLNPCFQAILFLRDEKIIRKEPQSIFHFKNQLYLQLPVFPDIRPYICNENKIKTMKTKSVVFALMLAFVSVAAMAADPVGPKVVIINQKESGIFKVIYEGAQTGKVSLKIFNKSGKVVFAETINGTDGFIRPVNFSGMDAGEYTIEVSDAAGKQINKLEYNMDTKVHTVHVAKIGKESKYLLAVANQGSEEIIVRIFDGANNLVHNENLVVDGSLGLVYNLKNIAGVPTFEVTNQTGSTKIVKY
jgi:hypothetical protein